LRSLSRRKNRSEQTQARGAAPELCPPPTPPRPWGAFHGVPIRGTQPGQCKIARSTLGAQRRTRGVGARCHHTIHLPPPAPRPAHACAACPPARPGLATAVRQHRGLEGLPLTQEPYGSTLRSLARREERQPRGRCRPSDPSHRGRPMPVLRGRPGRRGEPLTSRSVGDPQSPLEGVWG
jgi:hypothetical protein